MAASAIIVAAGSGVRLGSNVPKAFVKIGFLGRTMLSYSLAAIGQVGSIDEVVIAVPEGFESAARAEAAQLGIPAKITPGGIERQDSVRIALALTSAESDLVIVHDAARPLATPAIFEACLAAAARAGGAIAAIPVADTLKRVDDDKMITMTVARAGLWQAQTPQAFRRDPLIEAHRRAVSERIVATDDADLVERIGVSVEVVEASTSNIKITTPSDLAIVEAIIAAR